MRSSIGVRMPRAFGLRMWMAPRLFELAGLVSGTNVVIEIDDDDGGPTEADLLADLLEQVASK